MAKKRVLEVAKRLGLPVEGLVQLLKVQGIKAENSFSVVDEARVFQMIAAAAPGKKGKKTPEAPPPVVKAAKPAAVKPEEPAAPPPRVRKAAPAAKPEPEKPEPEKIEDKKAKEAPRRGREKPVPVEAPLADKKGGRKDKDKDKKKKKGGFKDKEAPATEDIYDASGSPSKRYDAIKKKGLVTERKGLKTTFMKKRGGGKRAEAEKEDTGPVVAAKKVVRVSGPMTVKELAHESGLRASDIIMHLMKELSLMAPLNHSLDLDIIQLVCEQFDVSVEMQSAPDVDVPPMVVEEEAEGNKLMRPPVVTIMGHVDHGKTRLLDTIRHTNVIDTESGGITQHIGAYQITHNSRKITFLDTPGHESFTALRARGAKVTDLAVLVVAADDGVKPQTVEAIDHARDAKVPILVAINKIDKPDSNPDRVRQQLAEHGLVSEEWGGETVMVSISAKFNQNIEDLLDMVFLVTELQELKANPNRKAAGTVIEAQMDKGKGPTASVLVQNGTLKTGDYVVCGLASGRVRSMETDRGERIDEAPPSMPIRLYGLDAVPEAGDQLFVLDDEKTVKEIVSKRRFKDREEKLRYESRISLEDLFSRIKEGKISEFKVIVKADVQGSVEAISQSLAGIKHEEVRINVIRAGVGEIKETDVMLAAAAGAVILSFQTGINPAAHAYAQRERVDVRHYDVIYKLIDDVKMAMAGLLAPEYEEVYTGSVEVRQIFESSRVGRIAGCYVTEGEINSGAAAKLIRDGKEIYKGKISTLKRFKDNVKNVAEGFECGIVLDGWNDLQQDDKIEAFKVVEKKRETI